MSSPALNSRVPGGRSLPDALVFTSADAALLGWSPDALRHAVRAGHLSRLRKGVYTAVHPPGPIEHALAAARLSRRAAVSHRSATLVRGLPLIAAVPRRPELTVPPGTSGTDVGVHMHRATLRPCDVAIVHGAWTTTPARTFVDVARHHPLLAAVALGDAVLRGGTRPDAISDVLRFCWNWPGIARAQRAARLLDAAAESPLESISRVRFAAAGLPAPALQQSIHNDWNGFVARVDFYWDEYGVVGEADGELKYTGRDALIAEKRRQERLEQLGLVVVRWSWREIERTPHVVIARIRAAFARASRSAFPRQWVLGTSSGTATT